MKRKNTTRRHRTGRGQHTEEHENHERWLVSYADFITLLFAFFAVLYATSQQDMEKGKQFEDSIKKYLMKFGAFGESGGKVNQGQENNSPIEAPIKRFGDSQNKFKDFQQRVEIRLEKEFSSEELKERFSDIYDSDLGVNLVIANEELFMAESSLLKRSGLNFLARVSQILKQSDRRIFIGAHAVGTELGKYSNTWDLAAQRATTMVRYLSEVHHIPKKQLVALSFGDAKPAVPNYDQRKNSRIEFILLGGDSPL